MTGYEHLYVHTCPQLKFNNHILSIVHTKYRFENHHFVYQCYISSECTQSIYIYVYILILQTNMHVDMSLPSTIIFSYLCLSSTFFFHKELLPLDDQCSKAPECVYQSLCREVVQFSKCFICDGFDQRVMPQTNLRLRKLCFFRKKLRVEGSLDLPRQDAIVANEGL